VVTTQVPRLGRILETSLYVDDLDEAASFYETLFDLKPLTADQRLRAYDVGGQNVLLLFRRGETLETVRLPGGTIPPHDGAGPVHLAFAIDAADLTDWEALLTQRGIAIEGRTAWPLGGRSIYFRDPANHLLELATPGIWRTY
jgi:catechol-2,3-dioxygenase